MLVTKPAPDFKATALMGDNPFKEISLSDYKGKKVVLFFYPLDFTFVCPTEILAFNHRLEEFEKRGVQVLACSVDSKWSHLAWKKQRLRRRVRNLLQPAASSRGMAGVYDASSGSYRPRDSGDVFLVP